MNIEEFEILYNTLKSHKDEIFIEIDKKALIENYKSDPEQLIKILKNLKNRLDTKEIKKKYDLKYDAKIINFILNYMKF